MSTTTNPKKIKQINKIKENKNLGIVELNKNIEILSKK